MPNSENIAIIGAGLMGHGIAQIFAAHGYTVMLIDVNEGLMGKAIGNIRLNLILMAQNGIGHLEDIESTLSRIRINGDLKEAASEAQFVVEAVTENLN